MKENSNWPCISLERNMGMGRALRINQMQEPETDSVTVRISLIHHYNTVQVAG